LVRFPPWPGIFFKLVRCGYTLRVTSQASYSPEYTRPAQKKSYKKTSETKNYGENLAEMPYVQKRLLYLDELRHLRKPSNTKKRKKEK
jgi:hypothetical protein